jgi:hypothetical protein
MGRAVAALAVALPATGLAMLLGASFFAGGEFAPLGGGASFVSSLAFFLEENMMRKIFLEQRAWVYQRAILNRTFRAVF